MTNTGVHLENDQRDWVLAHALGNPLALIELCATAPAIDDPRQLISSLPHISPRLEQAFAPRLLDLPADARDALLIAAVGETRKLPEILAAASHFCGRVVTVAALNPAQRKHLVRVDDEWMDFWHPLVRSSIAQQESVVRRQAAHAAWVQTLPAHSGRRTRHRAGAASSVDDTLADELETLALGSVREGRLPAGIVALETSAQLTTVPAVRARRYLVAAELATDMGRVPLADRLVSSAQHSDMSGINAVRLELLREAPMATLSSNRTRIGQLCELYRRASAAGELDLALKALVAAAQRCWWSFTEAKDSARVADLARRAYSATPDARCIAALALAQPVQQGRQVMAILDEMDLPGVADATALRMLGLAAHAVGDEVRATELSSRAENSLRSQGRVGALGHALGVGATARLDLGDWAGASASSAEGAALARDAGQLIGSAGAIVTAARYLALRGATSAALLRVAEVEHHPLLRTLNNFLCRAQIVRGIAWISAGRHADAAQALERVFDPHDPSHHEREQIGGIMYLAEAAVVCNRRVQAGRIVADMADLGAVTTSPLLYAHLLYAGPMLADDEDAERLYLESLAHNLIDWPWVRGRILLAYGSWLRRQRRGSESRDPLRAALTTFDRLGADAWATQARVELQATGERREPPAQQALSILSAQELQITYLVARGLSNAEIGQQLHLSPRTVGSHLYRIFPKLDITSRGQIASLLRGLTSDPGVQSVD